MCGIGGIVGRVDAQDRDRVARMIAIESHRGPDAGRLLSVPGAVLGHRRLSIIDLSDRGLQPMRSARDAWLVFNGEIYNYRELRTELAEHYQFTTDSDSEVLLAAWHRWGEGCLDHLNGMFAFCIFDSATRQAFFARDRFGQKPLFLSERSGRLLFASEVKSLLAAGVVARPNRSTWARYLSRASYDDTRETFFEDISQLMPGECATYDPVRGLRIKRYYDVAMFVTLADISATEAARKTQDLLIDAARLHMRADVPVGVSLSGGLDSSALLACLDVAGELHAGVKCVSVDFGGDLTERPWIEAAARHHSLPFEILGYTPEAFRSDIRPLLWHLEGPIGGLMNCALVPVMAAARAAGIKVVQDGTGLDEAFAGYRNHHDLYLGLVLRSGAETSAHDLRAYCQNWNVSEEVARSAAERALSGAVTAIDGTIAIRPELLAPSIVAHVQEEVPPSTGDLLRDGLIDYLQVRKIPRNTRMKDRLSMAYGLELRLPFLDHRLVEFALSLPAAHYFTHGRSKSIVREALAGAMDDTVRTAVKRSIQAPQGAWMRREPMRSYIASLIESESFSSRGFFDVPAVKAAFARFCSGEFDNSFFVWQWINVEEWHRMFIDGDAVAKPEPLCPEIACVQDATDISAMAVA
jgi:asparagine synthase (glutamine-hydrolysing)